MFGAGIKQGDRVSYLAYNQIEVVEIIFAAAKIGAILVPLNWRLAPRELGFMLSNSGTETLFFDASFTKTALEQVVKSDGVSIKRIIIIGGEAEGAEPYENCLAQGSDAEPSIAEKVTLDLPYIIMYTAGTTGLPKGAVLTQNNLLWNAILLEQSLDMNFHGRERNLVLLPLFHVGGISNFTLLTIHAGSTVILQRTFDAGVTLRLLKNEKITICFIVPAMALFMMQHADFGTDAFKTLRVLMCGASSLPPSVVQRYHEEAGILIVNAYGMTEASPLISYYDQDLGVSKAGSVGKAALHVELRIVDDNMNDVPVKAVGEVVIRGPNVMTEGYWKNPEATKEAWKGGWFHTGDLAMMDEDGDLYIVDRSKDMFISGGENVYPAEIENVIYELPQVAEAAVIGVKDLQWGEVGKAIVVLKAGEKLSETHILDYLKPRLAKYKVPTSVVFIGQLPRNAAGKVLKRNLREKYR
jgi:fatty-acyl-CoA synthase